MSEMKHTPGPWGATTRRGSWDWLVYSESDPNIEICQMFHDGTEFNDVGEANSRLVAAAPEMLAALKSLCDEDASYHGNEVHISCADHGDAIRRMRVAREVIAKAEGRQP